MFFDVVKKSLNEFNWELFHFEFPDYNYLILFILLFLLLEFFPGRKTGVSLQKLNKFIDPHLLPHLLEGKQNKVISWLKTSIFCVIFSLLIFSLANPRWSFEDVESFKPNVNLIFLLDLSRSMDVEDVKPSRLKRAKQEIQDVVNGLEGVNFALVGFANQSYVISPLTNDKKSFTSLLPSIDTDLVPAQGSNLEAAINSANLMLKSKSSSINYVLLISDGDIDTDKNPASFNMQLENATMLAQSFGTYSGAPIPVKQGGFLKYQGKMIISRANSDFLKNMVGVKNFIESSTLDQDLDKIKQILLEEVSAQEEKSQTLRIWRDDFFVPLLVAMTLLLPFFRKSSTLAISLVFILTSIMLNPTLANAENTQKDQQESEYEFDFEALKLEKIKESLLSGDIFRNKNQKAVRKFYQNKYDESLENFDSLYNKGVSAYRMKDFQTAENYFSESLKQEDIGLSKKQKFDIYYNLANSQLSQLKAKEAISNYEKALKIIEDDQNAQFNLELAKKLIQNQNQNKDKNQDQQNQNDKNQDQNDQQNQSQDKQDQNQSDDSRGDSENNSSNSDQKGNQQGDQKDKSGSDKGENSQDDEAENSPSQQGQNNSSSTSSGNSKQQDVQNLGNNGSQLQGQNMEGENNNSDISDSQSNANMQEGDGSEQQIKIDPESERLFNRLSGNTGELLKRRFKMESRKKDNLGKSGSGFSEPSDIKPW